MKMGGDSFFFLYNSVECSRQDYLYENLWFLRNIEMRIINLEILCYFVENGDVLDLI